MVLNTKINSRGSRIPTKHTKMTIRSRGHRTGNGMAGSKKGGGVGWQWGGTQALVYTVQDFI